MIATILVHLLAAYAVLFGPWLGRLWYERVRKRIVGGGPDVKVGLYRELVVEQIITTVAILALSVCGRIAAPNLGLVAPRSWVWNISALVIVLGVLVWSSLRLRPRAGKIRERERIGALLPDSPRERWWFGAVSLGAGVSEELLFRGFLLYYFTLYVPHTNTAARVLLASLSFGLAHLYQGGQGVVGTAILGLVLAGLYLMTGSLLLPILIHAALDLRVLLIFRANAPTIAAEGNA